MDVSSLKEEFDIQDEKDLVLHIPPSGSSRGAHVEIKNDERCTFGSVDSALTRKVLEDVSLDNYPPSTKHDLEDL